MTKYLPRVYDKVLEWRLKTKGAILIVGAKWCGKTSTAKQKAKSSIFMQDPANRQQNILLADISPQTLLDGATPRLIDEWQDAPKLWDAVRFEVDKRSLDGQFILTGSVVPPSLDDVKHTGTGRIARMKMRTMSLFESGESTGVVSLSKLFDKKDLPVAKAELSLDDVAFLTCRGGWPSAVSKSKSVALQQAKDYVESLCEFDISRYDGIKRNPSSARKLLRSYARASAQQTAYAKMRADLNSAGQVLGESALTEYIAALTGLFVIEDLQPWCPNLRSKTTIQKTPTRHFMDPSIATTALLATPKSLMDDLNTFGLLFETLAVRDLRVYTDNVFGSVLHYRNKAGQECDAVVISEQGDYGLVEIKIGGEELIEEGAKSLKDIYNSLDPDKMNLPSFMMVLTAIGDFSYMRPDGVMVVPIGCLGP